MHLQKRPDGSIRLSRLNPWEVQTFRSLPDLADFSSAPAAEKRLLPAPAVEADLSPELAMDWVEYVVPELRESFAHNLAAVMADLAMLAPEPVDPSPPEPGGTEEAEDSGPGKPGHPAGATSPKEVPQDAPSAAAGTTGPAGAHGLFFTLTIPPGHVEAWFRAMNQARLVLSARYGIDSEHVPDLAQLLENGQLEHWFQYELFVSLQGWLVEAVLDPD